MDSLTQIALGSAVGVAVMGRRTAVWKAALWGAIGGTLPDLDTFIDHGDPATLLSGVGLDAKGIAASIRQRFGAGEPRLVVNNS